MKTGLESLDTGAPEITYSGNEGPKSPQQMQQMQMAQLEEEYDAYVDDMIEQGIEPMSMQQFLEQIAAEAQMSSNEEGIGSMMEDPREMAADGGIMGSNAGSMLVTPTKDGSRPGYYGPDFGHTNDPGTDFGRDSYGDGPTSVDLGGESGGTDAQFERARKKQETAKQEAKIAKEKEREEEKREEERKRIAIETEKARVELEKKLAREKKEKEIKDTKEFFEKKETKKKKQSYADKLRSKTLAKSLNKKYGLDFDPSEDDFEEKVAKATETVNDPDFDMGLYGISGQDLAVGAKQAEVFGTDGQPNLNITQTDFENVYRPYDQMFVDGEFTPGPIIRGDNTGGGGDGIMQVANTQPDTQPDTNPYGDISTDFVDFSGTQQGYSNPAFAGQYFYGKPTITLANGGRANFAGGGIADLRQGYFLGKLVKKITKPFKKAFKGFKKIAKSPLGKIALMYFGGNLLQGNALFGNPLSGNLTNKLGSMFTSGGTKANLSGFSKLGEGFKNIAKSAFKPENAFATISGISGLSGLYTSYMNNKREDESMADYQRRLEEERGNFGDIPVAPVQFAANGGRMGFAGGGDDDDDDDDFRSKALSALYSMRRPSFSMGGGAGMPPVTMMSEGQDTQSFGDDESTGMANATPTMPNQMPMRPPMMDPRMQQQMMMQQRMNPMMNRGMMSMQQPRIMAQEGGRMNYNKGGSVITLMDGTKVQIPDGAYQGGSFKDIIYSSNKGDLLREEIIRGLSFAQGGRIPAQEGGMMDMGGMEKDYRNEGGFVPIGEYERKDDVPARLSKNEFVFTADAVRNAGGGDIDRGAEIMENMMENLEQGGKVSEASQGLSGAREMFQTSQRLEEVL